MGHDRRDGSSGLIPGGGDKNSKIIPGDGDKSPICDGLMTFR